MAEETTHPQAGVEQPSLSVEERLGLHFTQDNARTQHKAIPNSLKPEPAPEAPPEPTAETPEDPATAEAEAADVPPDDAADPPEDEQSQGDGLTIVHNGQEVTLNREDAIKYARQGFDYDRKVEAVAEDRKQVHQALEEVQKLRQAAPQLMSEYAQVQAIANQVKEWQNVDWVKLATDNPMEYPRYRAQFDQLERSLRVAVNGYEQKANHFQVQEAQAKAALTQQEMKRLPDLVPEFKNATAYQKAAPEIRDYLVKRGVPAEMVDSIQLAPLVAVAYDGLRYQKLQQSKPVVQKQLRAAAPMGKPSAAQSPTSQQERGYREQRAMLKKSGSVDDAARLLAGLGKGSRK